jgi:hypothetical protein
MIEAENKYVCRKCRLVRELTAWTEEKQRRLALACAQHVEHLSKDPRVKACNDTAERYLNREATKEEWEIAYADAWDATRAARYAYTAHVAHAATRAAWVVAYDPYCGSYIAAYVAYTANAAAGAAAGAYATYTYDAYTDAAYADERRWQAETLREMLGEEAE